MSEFFVSLSAAQSPLRGQRQIVVIGNFDGVHLGHRQLLNRAMELKQKMGLPAVVLTFDPHPLAILRPPHQRLFDLEDQQEQFRKSGLDGVIYLPFSRDLSQKTAEQFLNEILGPELNPQAIIVGFNFHFGANRSGSPRTLQEWGLTHHCQVEVVDPVYAENKILLSTSEVRQALQVGDVERAMQILGRPFRFSGVVVYGQARGRGLGFPTANIHIEKPKLLASGVYATRAAVAGQQYNSITHLGPLPTFADEVIRLETHIFDYQGQIYGQRIDVDFVSRIRGIKKFDSGEDLKNQISIDCQIAIQKLSLS